MKLTDLIATADEHQTGRVLLRKLAPEILDALRMGYTRQSIYKTLKRHHEVPFSYRSMCRFIKQNWTEEEQNALSLDPVLDPQEEADEDTLDLFSE